MAIITQKLIRIASRGRYERTKPGRAIIGPQIAFYNERISEIEHLLKKYPRIKILEKLDDCRTMNLTLANYNKDNNVVSKPVSMVEPPKQEDFDENPAPQFQHMLGYKDEDDANKEQVPPEPVSEEEHEGEPTKQPPSVMYVTTDPTGEKVESIVTLEPVVNIAPSAGTVDETPVENVEPAKESEPAVTSEAPASSDVPVEVAQAAEPAKETVNNQQQGKKGKNKGGKGNNQQHDKATEVTPEEPK